MRHGFVIATLFCSLLAGVVCAGAEESPPAVFRPQELDEGVFLFRPIAGGYDRTNSLVVEQRDGLIVVESQPSPEAARELLAEIARLNDKPIRFLVLSHPHAESAGGASAFPDSTLVIGTRECHDLLLDDAYPFGAEVRARADDPESWTAPARRIPSLVLEGSLYLDDARHPVRIRPLARSHSRGALMVVLPDPGIYYLGATLFADRNPFGGDADVGGWLSTLNAVLVARPTLLVPLHGEPIDTQPLRRMRDSLAWARGQVEVGFLDRVPPPGIVARVLQEPDLGKHFDLDAEPSFLGSVLERAVEEAIRERRKRGLLP